MKKTHFLIAGLLALSGTGWLFSERVLFSMGWTDMGQDGPAIIEELRHDLENGRAGMQTDIAPCMKTQVRLNLTLHLKGYLPKEEHLLMQITVSSPEAMVGHVYLGPPKGNIHLDALPLCLESPEPLTEDDNSAFAYLTVTFFDTQENAFQTFTSEDAAPIFAWQDVEVELLEVAEKSRSGGVTRIHLTPASS